MSISRKISLIYSFFLIHIVLTIILAWFSMDTLSTIRAYIGGEGLWAKAQKSAVYSLIKYNMSHAQHDYEDFRRFLAIPLGDKTARIELEKENPDFEVARKGFLEGLNHPDEVDDMMILFRRFRNFHHINKAIQVWTEGDVYIDELDQLGEKLHSTFAQENHLEESEANKKYHASIMTRTEEIDDILFELENQFSYTLGEASRWAKNLLMNVLFWGTGISGMLGFFLAWNFSKKIKENLETAVKTAQQVAQGDFNIRIQSESRDETGQLLNAMQEMVDRLREMTNIAIAVTQGNYESSVRVRSDKDLLGMALNKMLNNLHTLSEENQKQHWLDQGRAELYEAMRAGHTSEILAQDMIDFLVPSIGGQIGAVYLNHQDVMRLTASYGYPCEIMKQSFMLGEGLVGQVAKTQKTLQIDEIPADYVRIESGLGNMVPGSIVLIPFVYERQTVAVMEICFSRQPHEDRLKLLDLVSHHIAIKFIAAETRSKMMKLLEETQHQAEVLQAQQEELQVSNEELESQTRALTRSEQSLNERQLQLRAINEELARKTLVLETSQKEIQLKNEALKKSSAELEEKAKALELSNQFKSEFLANMSHELRSPLNSLLILAEILSKNKEGNLTQKQVEFARTILHSGKGLLHLINDILDLSKVEAGKLELCHEDMRFEALLASMKHEFQSIADNKGLLLSMELDQQLPRTMQTDKLRIEQILRNFLSNAIKFTQEGEITLRIAPLQSFSEQIHTSLLNPVVFAVKDTGIGIPAEKQEAVFEAFRQADGSTSRKYGGTGLGLTIARKLAHLLGGEITLISNEGKGSMFALLMPLNATPLPEKRVDFTEIQQDHKLYSPAWQNLPLNSYDDRDNIGEQDRILLVIEDDASFSNIVRDKAHEQNFKVICAYDGKSGLELARKFQPDSIILDIMLPKQDGWSVLEELKTKPETRRIPVHFISVIEDSVRAVNAGAVGLFTKPISEDNLLQVFERLDGLIAKSIKRVLVVEKKPLFAPYLKVLLRRKDVIAHVQGHEDDILAELESGEYDCMLLNVSDLDISVVELLKDINLNSMINLPLLIIHTTENFSETEEEQLEHHFNGIVIKEARSVDELLQEIMVFLQRVNQDIDGPKRLFISRAWEKEIPEGLKILLVDDDASGAFALSQLLEEKKMEIIMAFDGKEALAKLENDIPDLILMDIMMPEMNGYDTIREIRTREKFNAVPIIALTAHAMQGDREKCLECGANEYLSKPLQPQTLFNLIKKLI
ncbi:MAG: response regulator [SAR324 cluster bacterium]|nr:response regulator [SAR324 cluster bacterium]